LVVWSATIHCRFRHFVPAVLIPLAIAAVFPRLFLTFTIIDALLAIEWAKADIFPQD
jgi:hypothetical protein